MKTLVGKRVLITGGGHGIGRELAILFAKLGANVCVTDIHEEHLEGTADCIRLLGGECKTRVLDVTDPENVRQVRELLNQEMGPIEILVNNAGIVQAGSFTEVELEDHLTMFEVNSLGPLILTHAFLPDLINRSVSYLINISDAAALTAIPHAATYAASKAAMLSLSESIRAELNDCGHQHVRVLSVCPSLVNSGMFHGAIAPKLTNMLDCSQLAQEVIQAIRHDREHLLTPRAVRWLPLAQSMMPKPAFNAFKKWLGVNNSMKTWVGHLDPNVLLDHDDPNSAAQEDTAVMKSSPTRTNVTEQISNS